MRRRSVRCCCCELRRRQRVGGCVAAAGVAAAAVSPGPVDSSGFVTPLAVSLVGALRVIEESVE